MHKDWIPLLNIPWQIQEYRPPYFGLSLSRLHSVTLGYHTSFDPIKYCHFVPACSYIFVFSFHTESRSSAFGIIFFLPTKVFSTNIPSIKECPVTKFQHLTKIHISIICLIIPFTRTQNSSINI